MNVAAKERKSKERWPEDYCPAKDCLWRVRTRNGVKPCPKHQARTEGLAPETIDLMEALVTSLREQQAIAPVLTEDELQLIRARVAGGSFDALDAGALLDHIDYVTDAYEQIVQRSAQEADRTQQMVLAKDEEIVALRDRFRAACERLSKWHNHNSSIAPAGCACEFCEELRTEHYDGYDIVNAAPAAGA